MQRVLDGLLYATENADVVHVWTNETSGSIFGVPKEIDLRSDKDYVGKGWDKVSLFRTKGERFFLFYERAEREKPKTGMFGGEPRPSEYEPAEDIRALTMEQARGWCEYQYLSFDFMSKHFEIKPA